MSKNNLISGLLLVIIILAAGWIWLGDSGSRKIPDVTFKTIKGEQITSADLQGSPALITFWATDCPGCIAEMPHLVELYHELADKGLNLVGVAMHYDPPDRVLAMVEAKKLPYPIALDPMGELARNFGNVQLTPTNFLIAPDGSIVLQKIGEMDMKHVRSRILKMLETG